MISGGNNETRTFRILSHTGDKFYRGDCRMQDRWDAVLEGYRTGGMQDWRDAGKEGCWEGGMQERREAYKRDAGRVAAKFSILCFAKFPSNVAKFCETRNQNLGKNFAISRNTK